MDRLLRLALMIAIPVFVGVTCGGDDSYAVSGTMVLTDNDESWYSGSSCDGSGGYSDISAGAQVVVRDKSNTIVGSGNLESGRATSKHSCEFAFDVKDLPKSDFYSVEVGHRGGITYSFDDMQLFDWQVALSLGGD